MFSQKRPPAVFKIFSNFIVCVCVCVCVCYMCVCLCERPYRLSKGIPNEIQGTNCLSVYQMEKQMLSGCNSVSWNTKEKKTNGTRQLAVLLIAAFGSKLYQKKFQLYSKYLKDVLKLSQK